MPERTFAVKELIEDNVYEFRVYAVNKVGDGPVGPSSEPVTAKDPWGRLSYRYHCAVSPELRNRKSGFMIQIRHRSRFPPFGAFPMA